VPPAMGSATHSPSAPTTEAIVPILASGVRLANQVGSANRTIELELIIKSHYKSS
jgi:hypothetical protein